MSVMPGAASVPAPASRQSLADFYDTDSHDLYAKCVEFHHFAAIHRSSGFYQRQYRVELLGPLDHRIQVRDPEGGPVRELICLDSNSYLGLHLHPRVVAAARRALETMGYGMPSAQLLSGTHRHLIELEETVSAFHGRPATLVFPSGYAANVGILTGLLRRRDFVARDRFSHASIHDGCRWSGAQYGGVYEHLDMQSLDRMLAQSTGQCRGKLIVTDGVFSMHGWLAPLRELRAVADRYSAKLLVDEAHSIGVIGATGRGLEEHAGLAGSIDILMGTFSKAPGSIGGYVTGAVELIEYLRFFARSSMFTASLPAPICAGITEALRVMQDEPEHRERLWGNARRLWNGLSAMGLDVPPLASPILTVRVGSEDTTQAIACSLFDAGIKVGSVLYPAVPRGQAILRLTANARHSSDELDACVEAIAAAARRAGILGNPSPNRGNAGTNAGTP